MQFHVPQFIDVEDKIFGPFTLKQFLFLGGSGGFVLILYSFFPLIVAIILGAPIVALGMALAFYKINNQPFINILESAFKFQTKGKTYVWRKEPKKVTAKKAGEAEENHDLFVPKLADSKLKDLAWSLDIKESIYPDNSENE